MALQPKIDDIVVTKCENLYKKIKNEASCVPAVSGSHVWDEKPSWFDAERFKRGQELTYKYFVSVFLGHLVGLTILFTIPTMITPLAGTKTHSTVAKLFVRYLAVFIHVKKWYDYDPYEKGSPAHKSLKIVNAFHIKVGGDMNKNVVEPGKNPVWISQYDMAVTVWCVVAPILLYPKKLGIHDMTREKIESIMFVWACIARILGVEDRFNIMLLNYDEAYCICKMIQERDYKPTIARLQFPSSVGFETCKGIAAGMQPLAPYISLQGLMKHWYEALEFQAEVPVESPLAEKIGDFVIGTLLKFTVFHWIFGHVLNYFLRYCDRNRKYISKVLEKKYPGEVLPYIPPNTFQPKELLALYPVESE